MNLPKLAIFDMDGLIFDTERLFMNKKAIILEEYGYPALEEDYLQTIGLAGQQLFDTMYRIYGPDYPAAEITQRTRALVNEYMENHGPDIKPGIIQLLQWFQHQGVPCCVASSTNHTFVKKYLKLANIDHFFSYIVGGEEVTRSKPDPEIFLKACQMSNITPKDALVFEDSENGIRAAFAAGIPVICIPDLKEPSEEILQMTLATLKSADLVIPFLSDPLLHIF